MLNTAKNVLDCILCCVLEAAQQLFCLKSSIYFKKIWILHQKQ